MVQTIRRYCHNAVVPVLDLSPVPQSERCVARSLGDRQKSCLGGCRRASVAVEFAVASVPLILMVFGFIATAAVFNTWSTMQSNTQYAARLMSTGQITSNNSGAISSTNNSVTTPCSSSMRPTQVEYYACTGLPGWTNFTVTATENCATPSVTVSLSTSAATAAIADIEKIFSGNTIVATTVMMKEGTCP
jgi:Flp pilus assembly protein TadG